MLIYIVMSDDDLFHSGHRPSGLEDYDFKLHDPFIDTPSYLHWSDARWYPGHPSSPYPVRPITWDEGRVTTIQPITPDPLPHEDWGDVEPKNVGSMISYGLLLSLVAYMFWVL